VGLLDGFTGRYRAAAPPIAPLRTGPKVRNRGPSKCFIRTCVIATKAMRLQLTVVAGCSIGSGNGADFAWCRITFSRVNSSPHCLSDLVQPEKDREPEKTRARGPDRNRARREACWPQKAIMA